MSRSNILLLTTLLAATLGALPAAAQKISVYRGNGQVICFGCTNGAPVAFKPLVVRVTDDSDRPLAGVTVNWSSTGGVLQPQTTTGTDGTSENFLIPQNVQDFLNTWLAQYVLLDDSASQEAKAKYPLREARVDVVEVPGKPGVYRAVAFLRPHFQLDELTLSMRLVAELPPSARG